ncbi:hybrid sensor histidine kinase/response regulator [Zooshikella harenae]|uniref:histidine kinase n=1 Tax=Zooshikella harenae TaxID=2827238 RepID=A0ABS5ZAC3_9GAMM|nr:ATP-binding protein [Zooshikella harenae]MBU2710939.1 response regulator [Zooshikella harenae]
MKKPIGIQKKLISVFLASSILPLVLFTLITAISFTDSMKEQEYEKLAAEARFKKELILQFFNKRKSAIQLFVGDVARNEMSETNTLAVHYLGEFMVGVSQLGYDNKKHIREILLKSLFLKQIKNNSDDSNVYGVLKGDYYENAHDDIHETLKSYIDKLAVHDLYLVGRDGQVIYSVKKGEYFAKYLTSLNKKNTKKSPAIARVFNQLASKESDLTTKSMFSVFETTNSGDDVKQYIAKPLFRYGYFIGAVIFGFSSEPLNKFIKNDTLIDENTEIFLVAQDHSSRLVGMSHEMFERFQSNPVVNLSLAGTEAKQNYRSFSGEDVFGVSSYIDIFNERWAVVMEIPSRVVLFKIYWNLGVALLTVIVLIFITSSILWYLSNVITRPIKKLSDIGENILRKSVTETNHNGLDEISRITKSFYTMQNLMLSEEASNREKSKFLAAASHDLRQPLHAMGLFISALSSQMSSDGSLQLLNRLKASHDSLTKLLNALMDMARLEACAVEVNKKAISVGALLFGLKDEFEAVALLKDIKLSVLPCSLNIYTDPILLERILRNLLTNAIRYNNSGGKVIVGCRRNRDKLILQVWDNGIGMTKAQQQDIFKAFVQHTKQGEGLGLGLAIVDRTITLLGHELSLNSSIGKGSVFSIAVPRSKSDSQLSAKSKEVTWSSMDSINVAVVDDDVDILHAMEALLGSWGCKVMLAQTSQELLKILSEKQFLPDVLLVDLELAGSESGVSVIQQVQLNVDKAIIVAIITGNTAVDHNCTKLSKAFPILHKPVSPAQLRSLLIHSKNCQHSENIVSIS